MSEPILFISHFRVKEGLLEELKAYSSEATQRLNDEKPRTLLFGVYLDEAGQTISFVHAFADAEALDLHFEGSDQRSQRAYEFIEPLGWEFYGSPSRPVLDAMHKTAAAAGVPLTINPDYVSGFFRGAA
jgi:quinol monooxygenase YgiN